MSRALVVSSSSRPLKPELRLAQAISEFEADLPDNDKARFKAQREQRPGTVDVMRLTAEIDRSISSKGNGRVFGPRWTRFLEGVQRFASMGDVLVGGSQYLPACAVWTLVRFSLLFLDADTLWYLVRCSGYIDKLSEFFMQIGRTTPRYQNMALLFPGSKDLQASYTEYYIVVVRLCHHVFRTVNAHRLKLLWSSNQDVLNSFDKELRSWSDAIRDEVNIQSVALAKAEQNENSQSRSIARRDRHAQEARRKEKQWLHLLNACSVYDHQATWKQARKSGNSLFYRNDPKYQDWKSSSVSSTLVYSGKLGAGKSVLLANIIDDLFLDTQSDPHHIAYFFCRHDISESLRARTVIGSLTKQLLMAFGMAQSLDVLSVPPDASFDIDKLSKIIVDTVSKSTKLICIVVDGLNECDSHERDVVFKTIGQWQTKTRILLCVSSRWEPDAQTKIRSTQLVLPTYSSIPDPHPELGAYIDSEIEARMSSGELRLGDPEIVSTIKEVLHVRSQGMFLWASLLIQWICDLTTDEDILQALPNSPTSLFDIYRRLLDGYRAHKQYQETVLKLIFAAYRPLTTNELREALSVEPGETEWNRAKLSNDITGLLLRCGGLVIVDEEELSVRLVHESARQFLLEGDSPYQLSIQASDKTMAQIITTYLNFSVFDTQISATVLPTLPGERIIDSALSAVSSSSSRLIKALPRWSRLSRSETPDISRVLAETAMKTRRHQVPDLSFEKYARKYWFLHSACALDDDSTVQILVKRLIEKQLQVTLPDVPAPLSWAISSGYLAAFEILTTAGTTMEKTMQEALQLAAVAGYRKVVERYLQAPDLFHVTDKYRLWCDLTIQSANKSWAEILKMLLTDDSAQEFIWTTVSHSQFYALRDHYAFPDEHIPYYDLVLQAASREWSTILRFWNSDQTVTEKSTNKHMNLASICLNLMLSADCLSKENICQLNAPGILRKDINKALIQHYIPSEVQYACLYWTQHLKNSNAELSSFGDSVMNVLRHHLLFWFEAVSLLDKASEMIDMLSDLQELFAESRVSALKVLLREAERFIRENHEVADLSPLQIHLSGSIFASQFFKDITDASVPTWLIKAPQMPIASRSPLVRQEKSVVSVLFSPDARQLAAASSDGALQTWNTITGSPQGTLTGPSDNTDLYAFSPNGQQLASGSENGTINIWDVSTAYLRRSFKAHKSDGNVKSIAFSFDGKQLATSSFDTTIKIWDINTGKLQEKLKGHSNVCSIAFSIDARQLATSLYDKTIKIWSFDSCNWIRSIETEDIAWHLTFYSNIPILETDQGNFHLDETVPIPYSDVDQMRLSVREEWINVNGQKLIWLPEEYRECVDTYHQYVAFGTKSGEVLFMEISFDELKRQFDGFGQPQRPSRQDGK